MAIAIKAELPFTPFLEAHHIKGFPRVKQTLLIESEEYGEFWLIGKIPPAMKRAATKQDAARIIEDHPEWKIVGKDDHFLPLRLNDPEIPQIPIGLLYQFSKYVAENWQ